MDRIDTPGSVGGEFRFGNPFADPPVPSTIVGATWLTGVQEEIAGVVEGAGITLDQADNGQLLEAIETLITNAILSGSGQEDTFASAPSSGSAGDPLLIVDTFGIAKADFTVGNPVTLLLTGEVELAKRVHFDSDFAEGTAVYWDSGNGYCRNSTTGDHLIGYATAAADGLADPTVMVRLNGTVGDTV